MNHKHLDELSDRDICPECGKKIKRGSPVSTENFNGDIVRLHTACATEPINEERKESLGECSIPGWFLMPL